MNRTMPQHLSRRAPRAAQRGVTLIELMVGFTIAILLTLAAVSFAAHETRLMGISRDRLDLAQASRAAIDLLADDLRQAGAGVGYQVDGTFAGLRLDNFTFGGIGFNPDGGPATPAGPPLSTGPGVFANLTVSSVGNIATNQREAPGGNFTVQTTDIGIITANGAYATIADYNAAGAGMFCDAPTNTFENGEIVVIRSQSSLDAFTAAINVGATVACNVANGHSCVLGCRAFTFATNPTFASDAAAPNRVYLGGEIAGGVQSIAWFAVADNGVGTLRRIVFDGAAVCGGRNNTCGSRVVDNVEALIAQAWTFDQETGVWQNAGQIPVNVPNRIRVDVELVVRSRKSSERPTAPVAMNLMPTPNNCVPTTGACNAAQDYGLRRVIRTSVEIKNSGRMALE